LANSPVGNFTGGTFGQMSLREAINLANILSDGGTITFADGPGQLFATAQTITLADTLELSNTQATATITIEAPAAGVTISGNDSVGVFQVAAGTQADFTGLTITDGKVTGGSAGGGIENFGTLSPSNCTIIGNSAGTAGGGIDNNQGILTMDYTTVADNTAGSQREMFFSGAV
jgi:hypothetical protein